MAAIYRLKTRRRMNSKWKMSFRPMTTMMKTMTGRTAMMTMMKTQPKRKPKKLRLQRQWLRWKRETMMERVILA